VAGGVCGKGFTDERANCMYGCLMLDGVIHAHNIVSVDGMGGCGDALQEIGGGADKSPPSPSPWCIRALSPLALA
jgi:hypothetical protein